MKAIWLTWGDSAASSLYQVTRLRNDPHTIIAMIDDLRFGTLEGADSPQADNRLNQWQQVWRAQWWHNNDYDEKVEATLVKRWSDAHRQLLKIFDQRQPVVTWLGNNAHDSLMLAMIAAHLPDDVPLEVVNVSQLPTTPPCQAVGSFSPHQLLSLKAKTLGQSQRAELSQLWLFWQQAAQGWRMIDANGKLQDLPVNFIDQQLLAGFSQHQPRPAVAVTGELMGSHPAMLPDDFLFWRLALLRQQGRVVFSNPPGKSPYPDVTLV